MNILSLIVLLLVVFLCSTLVFTAIDKISE